MMKHPEFDQMVALAERLRLELDSSDRKNLLGSQIIPDKFALPVKCVPVATWMVTALIRTQAINSELPTTHPGPT